MPLSKLHLCKHIQIYDMLLLSRVHPNKHSPRCHRACGADPAQRRRLSHPEQQHSRRSIGSSSRGRQTGRKGRTVRANVCLCCLLLILEIYFGVYEMTVGCKPHSVRYEGNGTEEPIRSVHCKRAGDRDTSSSCREAALPTCPPPPTPFSCPRAKPTLLTAS